ncbi:hypothetical protein [Nocardioides taihuensis]|uniref:Translation elongation factor EFTu/EF1A C-terminal domain-containing protein n=1 Tax=Nocardioides taihuensis TaxID=1835606 RepID=A0ABW0BEN6_9ACTN
MSVRFWQSRTVDDRELARWQKHEQEHGYIRARLHLLSTHEGGRSVPIFSGYRSSWGFPQEVHEYVHDGPLLIEDQDTLSPGEVATVRLHPLVPDYWPEVSVGLSLGMFEGSRKVGEAVVIEVVEPSN